MITGAGMKYYSPLLVEFGTWGAKCSLRSRIIVGRWELRNLPRIHAACLLPGATHCLAQPENMGHCRQQVSWIDRSW